MLRLGVCRSVLNGVDERVGHITLYRRRDFRVSDLVAFVFHTPRLQRPFLWKTHVGRSTFVVPVDPTFPDPRKADPWGPSSYWRRRENRQIRRLYEAYLRRRPSGVLLDVGANFGMHTYPFAASGYRCVAFEPLAACCDFIRRVSHLNGFTNITVVESAVGAMCHAAVPFFESQTEAFSSMRERHVATFNVPWQVRTVGCVTVDSYCRDRRIAPTFIKIDTEGSEDAVLVASDKELLRDAHSRPLSLLSDSRAGRPAVGWTFVPADPHVERVRGCGDSESEIGAGRHEHGFRLPPSSR